MSDHSIQEEELKELWEVLQPRTPEQSYREKREDVQDGMFRVLKTRPNQQEASNFLFQAWRKIQKVPGETEDTWPFTTPHSLVLEALLRDMSLGHGPVTALQKEVASRFLAIVWEHTHPAQFRRRQVAIEAMRVATYTAVGMCLHIRLGEKSLIKELDDGLVRMVLEMVTSEGI
jgi:hypothetical protein